MLQKLSGTFKIMNNDSKYPKIIIKSTFGSGFVRGSKKERVQKAASF